MARDQPSQQRLTPTHARAPLPVLGGDPTLGEE
jgi:hypothetical protein